MPEIDRDRRTATGLFLTLFVTYAWFFGGSGFSQNAQFSQSRAIVERHTLAIDHYLGNTADLSHHGVHTYPNKPPGMGLIGAIPYAGWYLIAGAPEDAYQQTVALYVVTVAVNGLAGAALGALLFLLARRLGTSPRGALAIAVLTALGTPLFAYSTMFFLHVPSAFFVLLSFGIAAGLVRRPIVLAGVAAGAATCINYLAILAVVAIGVLIAVRSRQRMRDMTLFIAGGIPFAALLAAYQWAAFGSPFRSSIATTNPAFLTKGALLGVFAAPRAEALWGITFSPYRGLFYIAPVLLLGVFGAIEFSRDRARKPLLLAIGITLFLFLGVNASFNGWHGGYAIGPRYLIPVIPLLALLLTARQIPRTLFVALGAISLFLNLAATAVDPQPPDQLRDPFGRYVIPALLTGQALQNDTSVPPWIRDLYTGHTSTNRVSADEMLPFQHHRPGSASSEWASFNLGETIFGPGAPASLLPLLAFWCAAVAWLMRITRVPATPG